jgi:hypothetical protein
MGLFIGNRFASLGYRPAVAGSARQHFLTLADGAPGRTAPLPLNFEREPDKG